MRIKFKNLVPVKSIIIDDFILVGKVESDKYFVFFEGVFCFEGIKKECLDFIKPQYKKVKPIIQKEILLFNPQEKTELQKKIQKQEKYKIIPQVTQTTLF